MQKNHPLIHSIVAGCLLVGLCAGVQIIRAEGATAGSAVKLPFTIFEEKGSTNNHYAPYGWMGNIKSTKMDDGWVTNPHGGNTCLRFEYSEPGEWAGVAWLDPENDWGDQPGGWNLTGATKLKFWARGDKGGEIVCFKFGILGLDKKYSDSATGGINDIKLTPEWKAYAIDLEGKDLTHIKSGFVWTLRGQSAPVVFFLDDIRFE